VHSIVLLSKTSWYQAQPDLAANFLRAWDAVTKWIYDPANKAEVLAISKKAMGGTDAGVEAVYQLHVVAKSVPQNLRITEQYMQQFLDNLRKVGTENLPSDPMKFVDSSLVQKVLNT
jgi:ABC-type nitrate/sulfonate/bicarbonate transport system substrate-binding protein